MLAQSLAHKVDDKENILPWYCSIFFVLCPLFELCILRITHPRTIRITSFLICFRELNKDKAVIHQEN